MTANAPTQANPAQPVVSANGLRQVYPIHNGFLQKPGALQAVSNVSFSVQAGKTLAVVGESGCGKSTLARMVALIESPTAGELRIGDLDVASATGPERKALRRKVQLVFQNPYGSLNPRQKIGKALEEPSVQGDCVPDAWLVPSACCVPTLITTVEN